jgi:redox-sensitive bicupin YhaK (pirin superfamily)
MQCWVALPRDAEETAPAFEHLAAGALPRRTADGVDCTVIAGTVFGLTSPVATFSPMGYAAVTLAPGREVVIEPELEERAVYVAEGDLDVDGSRVAAGTLALLRPGASVRLRAITACRCMVLGGAPADGPRHIWWNFVSSRPERIEQAKADWQAGRFAAVPGEDEFIPLPAG